MSDLATIQGLSMNIIDPYLIGLFVPLVLSHMQSFVLFIVQELILFFKSTILNFDRVLSAE